MYKQLCWLLHSTSIVLLIAAKQLSSFAWQMTAVWDQSHHHHILEVHKVFCKSSGRKQAGTEHTACERSTHPAGMRAVLFPSLFYPFVTLCRCQCTEPQHIPISPFGTNMATTGTCLYILFTGILLQTLQQRSGELWRSNTLMKFQVCSCLCDLHACSLLCS